MIVVDAGVLAPALSDDTPAGVALRERLAAEQLAAPELMDLEVMSVLRRLVVTGQMSHARARHAVRALRRLPVERVGHRRLLGRCWQLHPNISVYDAAYVALAETMHVALLTADARLARAPGPRCDIELLSFAGG